MQLKFYTSYMEQEAYIEEEAIFETDLQLDMESRTYLKEAAKWARFLGILGFIGSGFILLAILIIWYSSSQAFGLLGNSSLALASMGMGILIFIYLLLAVISFLVALFTFRFGQRTSRALLNDQQMDLKSGLSNLRFIFRTYGIMAITYISIMILAMIFGALS